MEEETIVSPDPDPEVTTQNPLPLDTPNDAEMSNIQDGDGDILEPKSTFLQLAEDENDTIMKIDESPLPEKHMETEDDILNKFELNDASVADTILEKLEDTLLDEDMESDQLNGTVESPTVEVPILQNGLEETPHNDLVNVTEDPVISEGDKSKEEEDADLLKNQIMDTEDLLQIIPDSPVSHDIVEDEQVDEGDADTQPDSTDINEEATDDPYEDLDSENITLDEDDQIIKDPVENAVISDIEFNGETVMPNKNSFDKLDDLVGEKPPSLGDVFEKIEDLESQSHKLDTQMSVDSLTQHSVDLDGDEADEEDVTKTSKRTLTGTQLDKDSKKAKLDTVDKTGTSDQLSETDASDQVSEAGVPDPVSETEANDQDSEEAPTKKYKHLNLFSDFMRRKRIKTLTRADLEEFCLQKVCEAIYHVSEIGDLRHQLGVQEQMVEMWRKEVTQLAKQARDLEIVNKRLLHEVRQKYGTNKPIVPVKITRSVGLQVRCDNVLSVMAPRKPNKPPPNTVQPIAPKPATIPSTPTSKPPALATIKSAKVLTPKANALLSRALANSTVSSPTNSNPITTTAKSPFRAATSTPLRVIPVKQANAKIPSPKVTSVLTPTHATTSADKNYIDLTDDDDKKPLAVATPVKTVPSTAGVRIVKTSSASVVPSTTGANGPRIMYVYNNQLHQGVLAADPNKPGTQKLMLKLNSNMLDNAVASPDEIDSEPEEPYSDSGSSYAPSEGDISSTSSVSNATNGEKDLLDFDDDAIAIQNKEIASSSNISDTVETQTFKKNEKTSILNTQPSDDNLPINVSSVSNTKDCKTSHSKERENDVFINASVKINGKRGRDKMHACFFCNEVSCSNFARHIEVKHSNELQVAQILGMPKKSKQRRDAFATLLRSGDFFHNCNVLSLNSGELILTRRPTEFEIQNLTFSDFGPCPECLGFMLKRHIWHHRKYNCTEKVSNEKECSVNNDAGLKGSSAESTALLNGILRKEYSPQFTQHILNKLRDDEISNTCKRDDTILRFGAFLYEKYSTTQSDLIRQSMRQLGRFKLELQKQGETFKNISEILVPEKFDAIVNATKSMCVSTTQDITKRPEFKIPSLAIKLGFSIKKCAAIERGQALRMGDLNKSKQCLSFLHLVNLEWSVKISSNAIATLYSRRNNASDLLPVTSDLVKLSNFLDEELKQIVKDVTAQNYSKLLSIVLSGIILFNKRRSGEITRMTLHQYSSKPDLEHSGTEEMKNSLTPFENKLASSLTIVSIMGKRGRIVPILLTKGMIMSIDLLVVNRVKGNISSENPYIFAIPNTRMSHVKGHDCLKKWCAVAELESPELITSPRLRNYISTACQVLNLTENEYNWLAQHLGRDIRADRDFYWLQENAAELTKVSRLLLAVDQGEASKFSGKALTDMHIEGQTNGVLTTVPSSSLSVSNTSLRPGQPVRLAPAPASAVRNTVAIAKQVARHPAPLPTPPLSQLSKAARKPIPPRPHLSIRRSTGGIVLSWKMPYNLDNYESIASYQLYAYQETSAPPSSEMWRKVGDVKALALPMACTLTQFADGNKYHFAVRAVDVLNRMGQFSEPEQILL